VTLHNKVSTHVNRCNTRNSQGKWALELKLTRAQCMLHKELLKGYGFVVSDRSFEDDAGTAAWIIKGMNAKNQLIGQWYTPSQPANHSSFQSKLAGIVGVLYTLTFWPPNKPQAPLKLACDGLPVVSRLLTPQPIDPTEPHVDLLMADQKSPEFLQQPD